MMYQTREQAIAAALAALTAAQCAKGRHASYCEHRQSTRSPLAPRTR